MSKYFITRYLMLKPAQGRTKDETVLFLHAFNFYDIN